MVSNNSSKKDEEFAKAMALKLRLNQERLEEEERQRKLIEEAGEFRMEKVRSTMKRNPNLTVEEALRTIDE